MQSNEATYKTLTCAESTFIEFQASTEILALMEEAKIKLKVGSTGLLLLACRWRSAIFPFLLRLALALSAFFFCCFFLLSRKQYCFVFLNVQLPPLVLLFLTFFSFFLA